MQSLVGKDAGHQVAGVPIPLAVQHAMMPMCISADASRGRDDRPVECMAPALRSRHDGPLARIVSGIISGDEFGHAVRCPGSTAAVPAACHCGTATVAVSLAGKNASHYASAARVAVDSATRLRAGVVPPPRQLTIVDVAAAHEAQLEDTHVIGSGRGTGLPQPSLKSLR